MKPSQKSSSPKEGYDPRRIGNANQKTSFEYARSMGNFTTWWIHIWSGLVRDPTGKHHRALKQAIWLYLYFLVVANWRTGNSFRRISKIATETGFNPRTIHRWLKTLRDKGYIVSRSDGRTLQISITKWRPISRRRRSSPIHDPPP